MESTALSRVPRLTGLRSNPQEPHETSWTCFDQQRTRPLFHQSSLLRRSAIRLHRFRQPGTTTCSSPTPSFFVFLRRRHAAPAFTFSSRTSDPRLQRLHRGNRSPRPIKSLRLARAETFLSSPHRLERSGTSYKRYRLNSRSKSRKPTSDFAAAHDCAPTFLCRIAKFCRSRSTRQRTPTLPTVVLYESPAQLKTEEDGYIRTPFPAPFSFS